MTTSFTNIIWQEALCPLWPVDDAATNDDTPYTCGVCGATVQWAMPLKGRMSTNENQWPDFHNRHTGWVCAACDYMTGGAGSDSFRLWTVLWREDGGLPDHAETVYQKPYEVHTSGWAAYGKTARYRPLLEHAGSRVQLTSRGSTQGLIDLLLDPPDGRWAAAVAESGQKKIHRFTPITSGDDWRIQFELTQISSTSDAFAEVLYHTAALRKFGVSEDDIRAGELTTSLVPRQKARVALRHLRALDDVRPAPILELALYCLTKEVLDYAGRRAATRLQQSGIARSGRRAFVGDDEQRADRQNLPRRLVEARSGGAADGGRAGDQLPGDGRDDAKKPADPRDDRQDGEGDQLDLL